MAVGAMGAAPSNTYIETTAVGVKEDLRDLIFQIDVDATPMLSAISSVPSQQILTEWVVQDLGAVADNAQPEGFTAVAQPVTKPVRFNNVCQIVVRSVGVSNTTRAADFVGSEDEYNRQVILKGMEAKRDVEFAITSPLVRTLTDPRHMSGLPCYTLNGSRGAGAGVMPVGDGSNAGTPGTARDLTLAMMDSAVQQCWQAGSVPTLGIMSGNVKAYFATLHQILLVSPDYVELGPLTNRDFVDQTYAVTGDNQQGSVVFEGCIRPTAPKAHATIFDLNQ